MDDELVLWCSRVEVNPPVDRIAVFVIISKYERLIGVYLVRQFTNLTVVYEEQRRKVITGVLQVYSQRVRTFFTTARTLCPIEQYENLTSFKSELSKAQASLSILVDTVEAMRPCEIEYFWPKQISVASEAIPRTAAHLMEFDRYNDFCSSDAGALMVRELVNLFDPFDCSLVWPSDSDVLGLRSMRELTETMIGNVDHELKVGGPLKSGTTNSVTLWRKCVDVDISGFGHVPAELVKFYSSSNTESREAETLITLPGVGKVVFIPENQRPTGNSVGELGLSQQSAAAHALGSCELSEMKMTITSAGKKVLDDITKRHKERTGVSKSANNPETDHAPQKRAQVVAVRMKANSAVAKSGTIEHLARAGVLKELKALRKNSEGFAAFEVAMKPEQAAEVKDSEEVEKDSQLRIENPAEPKKTAVVSGAGRPQQYQSEAPKVEKLTIEAEPSLNSGWTHCDANSGLDRPTSGRAIESEMKQGKKTKNKTRSNVQRSSEDNENHENPEPQGPANTRRKWVFTDPTHYDTWRIFFPLPGQREKKSPLRWDTFRAAMEAEPLCFKHLRIKDVACTFERPAMDGLPQQTIVIHRPHTFILDRKRINELKTRFRKVFHWEAEDFELVEEERAYDENGLRVVS